MMTLDLAVYVIMLVIIAKTSSAVGRFDSHLERISELIHALPGGETIARGLIRKRLYQEPKENQETREKRRRIP